MIFSIWCKYPRMLNACVIFLHEHDNVRLHKLVKLKNCCTNCAWKSRTNSYMQLRFCNQRLFLFSKLQEHLSGARFSSDNDVKAASEYWLSSLGRNFYQASLNKLVLFWNKYRKRFGYYVENRKVYLFNFFLYFLSVC